MDATAIERLFLRVRALFGRGRVTYVDDSGPVQEMQVRMSGLVTADSRLRVAEFGFTSNPPLGSDVLALHVAGDPAMGAIVATNHQASRPTGLVAGESMLYSEDGKQVYLTASGGIVVTAKGQDVVVNGAKNVSVNCTGDFTVNCGGRFNVTAPGGVSFQAPLVAASGDVQDNAGSNAATMKTMRAEYDVHEHPVPNVQPGSATATTGTPVPTM